MCLLLFFDLLRVSEVFILGQRRRQLTSGGRRKEVHASTAALITQLSGLTHDPFGLCPSLHQLYVSCHCHPLLSSPGHSHVSQKTQTVIKTKGQQKPTLASRGQRVEVGGVSNQE